MPDFSARHTSSSTVDLVIQVSNAEVNNDGMIPAVGKLGMHKKLDMHLNGES